MSEPASTTGSDDGTPVKRAIVLHPRTAAARQQDRSRSATSHVRGHTVTPEQVHDIMRRERRSAVAAALSVIVPIFCLPPLYLAVQRSAMVLPPVLPWLVLGPIALGSLVAVGVIHERRVAARERQRSIDYADQSP